MPNDSIGPLRGKDSSKAVHTEVSQGQGQSIGWGLPWSLSATYIVSWSKSALTDFCNTVSFGGTLEAPNLNSQ